MSDRRHKLVSPKPEAKVDRRQFINAAGASLAAIAGAPELVAERPGRASRAAGGDGGGTSPDLIVINAKVYTMDPRAPRAEAFAVSGGRFVAVGSTSDIRNLAGKNTQTFDAKGMTVVPGFIDCHNHAGGEDAAERSARRQSLRGRVRQHPQHHRQAARARAEDAAGAVGRGLLLRRHQGERQARCSTFTISMRCRPSIR